MIPMARRTGGRSVSGVNVRDDSLLNLMMASEYAETCRSINNIITDKNLYFDFLTL
jgi:hypothetical protein